jgi:hypothetical protein
MMAGVAHATELREWIIGAALLKTDTVTLE